MKPLRQWRLGEAARLCQEVRQAVTYYLVRDFDFANTALINTKMFDANQAAVAGQLINMMPSPTRP